MIESLQRFCSQRKYVVAVLLFAFSCILYGKSFTNDFVWDSKVTFTRDAAIRDVKNLPAFFTHDFFASVDKEGDSEKLISYYRPFLKTVHMVEYQLFKENPAGYNSVNIILNGVAVSLAFLLVLSLSGSGVVALFSALLFAVNPSHVEAVSWAYSDSYIITIVFCLGSLFAYHRRKTLLSILLLVPALLTHELALQMFLVFLLYEVTMRREEVRKALLRLAPFAVLNCLYLLVRYLVVPKNVQQGHPIAQPLQSALVVLQRYFRIMFQPDGMITVYPASTFHFSNIELAASVGFCLVSATMLFLLIWKKLYKELFWFGWFFLWLLIPVAAIVVGNLGQFCMMDKSLYIPSLGFCVLIASLVSRMRAANLRTGGYAVLLVLVAWHAGYTFSRTLYWKDNLTYFQKAYDFEPDFSYVTQALGMEYAGVGQLEKARSLFLRTIQLDPNNSSAFCSLGNVFLMMGQSEGAKEAYQRALSLDSRNPMPYYNLGLLHERAGDRAAALDMYHRYQQLTPQVPPQILAQIKMLELGQ